MSVNKSKTKNKIPVRHCAEHGYGCKCRQSFIPIGGWAPSLVEKIKEGSKKNKNKHKKRHGNNFTKGGIGGNEYSHSRAYN